MLKGKETREKEKKNKDFIVHVGVLSRDLKLQF